MVTPGQMTDGIILFAESELLPALKGWQAWVATAALIRVRQQAEPILAALTQSKAIAALGLVDAEGMIDVDAAADALKEAARKHGAVSVDIPVLEIAYTFAEKDIETLRECINQVAGK